MNNTNAFMKGMNHMKRISSLLIALMLILGTLPAFASESGYIKKTEMQTAQALFARGTYTPIWQVSKGVRVYDNDFYIGEYTIMTNITGPTAESNPNYGSVELINRCRMNDAYQTIGLTNDTLTNITLRFRLKLDDVRNKDIEVSFSAITDSNGEYVLTGDYANAALRRDFVDSSGTRYISIGDYVEATTEWQTVEATLNLSDFTRVRYSGSSGSVYEAAVWSKASAIHIISRKTKNAFAGPNPPSSIEISYGDIYVEFNKKMRCRATIDILDDEGQEVTTLSPGKALVPTVTLENELSSDETVLMMFAVYQNGIMTRLIPQYVTVDAKDTAVESLEQYTLPSDVSGMEVIAYLWTDFVNMQPITKHLSAK